VKLNTLISKINKYPMVMIMRPNKKDLADWEALCHILSTAPRKASYNSYFSKWDDSGKYVGMVQIPNWYLLGQDAIIRKMRKWMKENNFELVFFSTGWGWRLRKDWKEKIEKLYEMIQSEE
jgi:hypothetical protein